MPTRTARTAWNGTLEEGSGQVELTSSQLATFDEFCRDFRILTAWSRD